MFYFFFNDTATTEIYTLSLHDALPIFSHGLCFGRRQLTILTPSPLSLTRRLCFPSHLLTSLEMCQLALSQIRSRTFLPISSSFWAHHRRNCVVIELTGRPSTNLSHVSLNSGT